MPTLRPGDVVVLDNLVIHKQPEVQAAIEQAGARLRFLRRTARTSIHRARVCEAESLHARRASAELRPGRRAHGDRPPALRADRVSELRAALRLSRRYAVMKNALAAGSGIRDQGSGIRGRGRSEGAADQRSARGLTTPRPRIGLRPPYRVRIPASPPLRSPSLARGWVVEEFRAVRRAALVARISIATRTRSLTLRSTSLRALAVELISLHRQPISHRTACLGRAEVRRFET